VRHKPVGSLSRSLGIAVTPKGHKVLEERGYRPGQHGRRRQDVSEYGRRLKEKQRLKAQYFISEKQLRRAFADAARKPGRTDVNLIQDLERRLDAVVLRSGFARSVYQARQLVSHGHVLVNDEKVDRPAYRLADGDVIAIRPKSHAMPVFVAAKEGTHVDSTPRYLEVLPHALMARVVRAAQRDEIPVVCDLQLVVEYYAR
jgi:small subunit ribosomal protein S4